MKKEISLLDLFSGIGGFALGLKNAGFQLKEHFFSEINKHAIAVYQNHFKNANYVGAIETIQSKIKRPNIITFGSPCQDFSIAGKRKGLAGERSSLIGQAIQLVTELRPDVFIWENVKGAFSSNNRADFWAIIQAFTNMGDYRLEWQLLNTAWLLPQNRERIYLVGHLRGKSSQEVFPFQENDELFNRQKKTRQGWPKTQNYSSTLTGKFRATDTYINVPKQSGTLTVGGKSGGLHSDITAIPVLTPNRKEKRQNGRRFKEVGDPSFTLTTQDKHGVLLSEESNGMRRVNLRRLTEIECERLQGFPDDWTKWGNYNGVTKEVAMTNRYSLIGNAVTANVVTAIGERLLTT